MTLEEKIKKDLEVCEKARQMQRMPDFDKLMKEAMSISKAGIDTRLAEEEIHRRKQDAAFYFAARTEWPKALEALRELLRSHNALIQVFSEHGHYEFAESLVTAKNQIAKTMGVEK